MHFKVSSAICFNLDQSKILSSGNGLMARRRAFENMARKVENASNQRDMEMDNIILLNICGSVCREKNRA